MEGRRRGRETMREERDGTSLKKNYIIIYFVKLIIFNNHIIFPLVN